MRLHRRNELYHLDDDDETLASITIGVINWQRVFSEKTNTFYGDEYVLIYAKERIGEKIYCRTEEMKSGSRTG